MQIIGQPDRATDEVLNRFIEDTLCSIVVPLNILSIFTSDAGGYNTRAEIITENKQLAKGNLDFFKLVCYHL